MYHIELLFGHHFSHEVLPIHTLSEHLGNKDVQKLEWLLVLL